MSEWRPIDPEEARRQIAPWMGESPPVAPWGKEMEAFSARLREAIRPMTELNERLGRALAPIAGQLPEWLNQASRWGAQLRASFLAAQPPNWREFEFEELDSAITLMVEHGLNVAWVPRATIIRELMAEPDLSARDMILVERAADIIEDVETCLAETTHPDLAAPVDALREAITAFRAGCHRASQALATVTLGAVIHDTFGEQKFADARRKFEELDPETVSFVEARSAAVLRCIARALQRTDVAGPGFNRHAAAHRLSADQYTQSNAVASLMLVAGLLRESHDFLTPEPEVREPEAA